MMTRRMSFAALLLTVALGSTPSDALAATGPSGTWAAAASMAVARADVTATTRVKYCGQYACDEPIPDAELYTP